MSGLAGLRGRSQRERVRQVTSSTEAKLPKSESKKPGERSGCPWGEAPLPPQPARNVLMGYEPYPRLCQGPFVLLFNTNSVCLVVQSALPSRVGPAVPETYKQGSGLRLLN